MFFTVAQDVERLCYNDVDPDSMNSEEQKETPHFTGVPC